MKKLGILFIGLFVIGCAHLKTQTTIPSQEESGVTAVCPLPKQHKKALKQHKPKTVTIITPVFPPNGAVQQTPSNTESRSNRGSRKLNILLLILTILVSFLVLHFAPNPPKAKKKRKRRDH